LGVSSEQPSEIAKGYLNVFSAYLKKDESSFQESVKNLKYLVTTQIPNRSASDESKLKYELIYNEWHPFGISWKLYAFAAVLWCGLVFLMKPNSKGYSKLSKLAHLALILGFMIHVYGFTLRCLVAGRPPVTNMYESIVWVSLGTVFFASIIYLLQPNKMVLLVASVIGTMGLIVSDTAPAMIDPGIHPLVPVLRSNYWLTIHVLTITLSYAALALSWGISNVTLFQYVRNHERTQEGLARITSLNLLSYRSMQIGVVLLTAGTILGGVWADYSWGRFWGWDPKEVWALIALMGYLTILHARYTGWMKAYGFAAWTVVSFALVVMAWYGVNFVLGVGLHSYGFSQGGQGTVASLMLIQIIYVVAVTLLKKQTATLKTN
jgi:cytochrome c-type biogenesis protein CcsB